VPPERREQLAVEGQAALDRRHDQVDVIDAGGTHAEPSAFAPEREFPAR
jgi:hypothetical protein